jgi:hypothetical protein
MKVSAVEFLQFVRYASLKFNALERDPDRERRLMQSPRHRVRERSSRRLALRSFFVKFCRARAIQLCALFTLVVNANAFRRERGWSIETSACDAHTSQRLELPGSQTSKAEEVSVTLGTVIRGTEWNGRTANERAVLNALDGLKRLVGVSNVVIFVDQDVRCDHIPSTYAGARCFGLEGCVDPIYLAPSMKCVFQTLLDATRTKHVGYINVDIVIFRDFLDTLAAIERDHDRTLLRRRVPNATAGTELLRHVSVGSAILFLHDDATPRFGSKIRRSVTDGGRFSFCEARLAFSGGRNRALADVGEVCGYWRQRMRI